MRLLQLLLSSSTLKVLQLSCTACWTKLVRNVGIKEVDGKDKADATGGKSCGVEKIAAGTAQPKFGATSPLPPNGKKFLGIPMQIFVDQPKSGATCTQKNPMESWTTSLLLLPANIFD